MSIDEAILSNLFWATVGSVRSLNSRSIILGYATVATVLLGYATRRWCNPDGTQMNPDGANPDGAMHSPGERTSLSSLIRFGPL